MRHKTCILYTLKQNCVKFNAGRKFKMLWQKTLIYHDQHKSIDIYNYRYIHMCIVYLLSSVHAIHITYTTHTLHNTYYINNYKNIK